MKSNNPNPKANYEPVKAVMPYPLGETPERDAWYTAFFIENHLDYFTHPHHAASPEQIRFMVFSEDDERFYPCSPPNRSDLWFFQRMMNDFIHVPIECLKRLSIEINRALSKKNIVRS
jgi:hypothetical protein